jgi:ficolin
MFTERSTTVPTYQLGMQFTTYDADHDLRPDNCAVVFHGAWWYSNCHESNLNGLYNSQTFGVGINWYPWRGYYYSLKHVEMKIRPEI